MITRSMFVSAALCLSLLGCRWMPMNAIQGSGVKAVETRTVGSFDSISIGGSQQLEIRAGEQFTLSVEGDDNIVPLIDTPVVGTTLDISSHQSYSSSQPVVVRVTMPTVRGIKVHGSADVDFDGMTSDSLDVVVSGSGSIGGKGIFRELHVNVSGSGDVDARECTVTSADCVIAGSGHVQLPTLESLKVSVAGSGDVEYRGSPEIEQVIAGSGSVRKVE